MSTLTSGVGLVSGLPIQDLVNAALAPAARPINLLTTRINQTNAIRTATLDISARLLALKSAVSRLKSTDLFRTATAVSSQPDVLSATASAQAVAGDYTFSVRNLATSHQVISGGFASSSTSNLSAGTLTLESVLGRVDTATSLGTLNGGNGVRAGRFRITDRAGHAAEIDLTAARNVRDVLTAVNSQVQAGVKARTEGDRIVLTDTSGGSGSLFVEDIGGGSTALDLGIRAASATGEILGADLVRLAGSTLLSRLNDGNGLRIHGVSDDIRFSLADGSTIDVNLSGRLEGSTPLAALNGGNGVPPGRISIRNRAGQTAEVDLSPATNVSDVVAAIQGANIGVTATFVGSHLVLTDGSSGTGTLTVSEVGSGTTASALGLDVAANGNTISGRDVYRIATVDDVLRVINLNPENAGKLVADVSSDGDHLRFRDLTSGSDTFGVSALNDSLAIEDLGLTNAASGGELTSRRLLAGLNSVLLRSVNGGSGATGGTIRVTDRSGASAEINLQGAETIDDVLRGINAAGLGVSARVSSSGLGIELADTSGGTGALVVEDVSGTLAGQLRIAVNSAVGSVSSGNLQRQYISESTRLDQFRAGIAFSRGKFRITDSKGESAVVDLTQGDEVTLGDVIREINSRGIGIRASINATGDGLLLTDTAGGGGRLTVLEEGGTTAKSLGILGQAAEGSTTLDGSLETRITVTSGDTLDTLLSKIRASRAAVSAALLNDGTASAPYRLSLTSTVSGASGQLVIDSGTTGLDFSTLIDGRDATVIFGPADSANPLVLSSTTNTLSGVIPGVTLNLRGTSTSPVTVSVARDPAAISDALKAFVDAYNNIVDRISALTSFNADTNQRGLLLGDSTTSRVSARIASFISKSVSGTTGSLRRLSDVGVRFGSGGKLEFDQTRFDAAIERDPAAVEELFTKAETGLGTVFEDEINRLTETSTGLLSQRSDSLQRSVDQLTDRKTQLTELLEKQRARLTARFQATETALSKLQSQQSALSALGSASSLSALSSIR